MNTKKELPQMSLFPEFPPAREGESGEIDPVVKISGRPIELMDGRIINPNAIIKKSNDEKKPNAKGEGGKKKKQ